MTRSETLKAVLDEDVEQLLQAIGLLDAARNGDLACRDCGRTLSPADIAAVVVTADGYDVLCDHSAAPTRAVES